MECTTQPSRPSNSLQKSPDSCEKQPNLEQIVGNVEHKMKARLRAIARRLVLHSRRLPDCWSPGSPKPFEKCHKDAHSTDQTKNRPNDATQYPTRSNELRGRLIEFVAYPASDNYPDGYEPETYQTTQDRHRPSTEAQF